jgi:hypothetical protein
MTVDVPFDVVFRLTARCSDFFGLALAGRTGVCLTGEASESDGATDDAADGSFFAGEGVYRTGAPGIRLDLAEGGVFTSDTTRRNCFVSLGENSAMGEGGCTGGIII